MYLQKLTSGSGAQFLSPFVDGKAGNFKKNLPGQRVPVRVESVGGQADQHASLSDCGA